MRCDDTISVNVPKDMGTIVTSRFSGRPIFWRDAPTTKEGYQAGFYDAGGFYDGAVRIWGIAASEVQNLKDFGNAHAVSDGTTP
jgi:hypothetical protein